MVYGVINRRDEKCYTYLSGVFRAIDNRQNNYNWLISSCECYPKSKSFEKLFYREYCWISEEELSEIIAQEDFQWIWAVLSGFEKDIPLSEVLKHSLPTVDYTGFWDVPPAMQHPLAAVEIVPFDSSFTLFLSRDKQLTDSYISAFPQSEELAAYNKNTPTRRHANEHIHSPLS